MQAGPLIGMMATVIGMRKAFCSLGASGINDPVQLSNNIGGVLVATAIGISIGLIGAILLFVSLLGFRYRAAWFYWFLVIYGVNILFAFPVGTVIGPFLLVYILTNRNQFLAPASHSGPPQTPNTTP